MCSVSVQTITPVIGVLNISDRASAGVYADRSGPEIEAVLREVFGAEALFVSAIVPDEVERIAAQLREFADDGHCDLIVTTGGTGVSTRDVTPEATLAVIDRQAPGIAELMRLESLKITPKAALSRAVSGIRASTLIINLPGSVKGVRECLTAVRPILAHAVETLNQASLGCGE